MRWLGKIQSGKYPYEGSICHKSKCYHWSLGRSSLGTNRSEILGAEFWQAKCGFCGPESTLLSWVWAIHTPPNHGLAYKTLENPSLEEEEGFFSCTEDLIFVERGQLLYMRSQEHFLPKIRAMSHISRLVPAPIAPPALLRRSPPIHKPLKPVGGRARAFCQPGSSSSAMRTNASKTSGCDPHFSGTVLEIITHPLKARAIVGVLHSLC